jgi:hypothetical protein
MATTTTGTVAASRSRRIWSRVGLALAGIMAIFNVSNGVTSIINPMAGLDPGDSPQPMWMSVALIAFGLATLAPLVSAWRGNRTALWLVIVTRLLEAWSAIILPFLPGAPDGLWPFVIVLIIVGTGVSGLVALGLRR